MGEKVDEMGESGESAEKTEVMLERDKEISEVDRLAKCKSIGESVYSQMWEMSQKYIKDSPTLQALTIENKCTWEEMGLEPLPIP